MNYYTEHNFRYDMHWKVKQNPVYRLLDNSQWLDAFFERGEIQLSCFQKFKHYPNEVQGDPNEGGALCWFDDLEGNTQGFKYEAGFNSYILSTTIEINDKIVGDFNAQGAIKILDTTAFALEISKRVHFCVGGMEGVCEYASGRAFHLKNNLKLREMMKIEGAVNTRQFRNELQIQTAEYELFLKEDKYQYQNEYRLIWLSGEKIDDSKIFECPEALQYCERIDFN